MRYNTSLIDISAVAREGIKVHQHELTVRDELAPKLYNYDASPEEARRWYHTFDPLNEGFLLSLALASRDVKNQDCENLHKMVDDLGLQIILASRVGDILLGSVMFGNTNNLASYYYNESSDVFSYPKNLQLLSSEVLELTGLSYDEVEDLSLASEAYIYSGSETLNSYDNKILRIGDLENRDEVVELSESSIELGISIQNTLLNQALVSESGYETPEDLVELDKIRIAGLKGLVQFFDKPSFRVSTGDAQAEPFVMLMHILRILAEGKFDTSFGQRLKMSHIKGPLHEIMWAIDTEMQRRIHPNLYGHINISPAHASADRPQIGKPKMYRSYDYMVTRNGVRDFIQLKSSPQKNKKHNKQYHPVIWVLEEDNFMEVNPKRLASKLQKYIDVDERGYKKEDREVVDKYTMPTAKWALRSANERQKSRSMLLQEKIRDIFLGDDVILSHELKSRNVSKLNRQQRRLLARNKAKNK